MHWPAVNDWESVWIMGPTQVLYEVHVGHELSPHSLYGSATEASKDIWISPSTSVMEELEIDEHA